MSDIDHSGPSDGEPHVLAAEYVLGLLSAAERATVERRLLRDPLLAEEVARWEERLAPIARAVAPVQPPSGLWSTIAAMLDRPAPQPKIRLWQSLMFWRGFAISSSALAAASLAALLYVGVIAPSRMPSPMVAMLDTSSGQSTFVATFMPDKASVMITPASLVSANQQSLQLWLMPPGEGPYSLGLIAPDRAMMMEVPSALMPHVKNEVMLAVSLEPPGGSPSGLPTGPVIAAGKLTSL